MSATNTETPAAESCSASHCSVRVFPVPVAPATSPWRFIIASGTWTTADCADLPVVDAAAEVDRRARGRVGRGDRACEVC